MDTFGSFSFDFEKNVGDADRFVRVVLGFFLIALGLISDAPGAWAGWLGLIPLISGLMGVCPGYRMMGMSTKK